MEIQELNKIHRRVTYPTAPITFIGLLVFLSTPFFWIWHSFGLAWKVGLTGLLLMAIFKTFTKTLDQIFERAKINLEKSADYENPPI